MSWFGSKKPLPLSSNKFCVDCLAHAETLRAMEPKAQVIVPEYQQVVEI